MLHADPSNTSLVTSALEAIAASGLVTMASGTCPTPDELESVVRAVREASNATRDSVDLKLATAAVHSMQTHTLTPIIKEELKIKIEKKRLAEGKPELKVEFKQPQEVQVNFTNKITRLSAMLQ